jgi:phytanoyl-CoA hydroxylase
MPADLTLHPAIGSLTLEQRATFEEQGFLCFRDMLTSDELVAARDEIRDLAARTFAAVEDPRSGAALRLPDTRMMVQFEPGSELSGLAAEELEMCVRKLMGQNDASPFFDQLATHEPRVFGVVEGLLGEAPVLFQDMALIKPPRIGSEKPWHQDTAYFNVVPLLSVVGIWIALDDATVENGCMHVLPGGHRTGPRRHWHDRDCEIVPERVPAPAEVAAIELPAGGALAFSGVLPHFTPMNRSAARRRALQYHYHAASCSRADTETYDTVFCEADGTPASCSAARD